MEDMNFLALNLAHAVAQRSSTVDEARRRYAETATAFMTGNNPDGRADRGPAEGRESAVTEAVLATTGRRDALTLRVGPYDPGAPTPNTRRSVDRVPPATV